MKILGLSFGRVGGNCDIVLKQALIGAMETCDVEVAYINTCHLKIDRCTGCGACDKTREKGNLSICVRKDDFQFLESEIVDADALIVAAPVYVLGATGQYKNVCDRIGPSHGHSMLQKENERRRSLGWGEEKLIPPKYFKNRPLALISVGGAITEGWTSMGLATMHMLGFPEQMEPVDALNVYAMGRRVSPVLDEDLMNRLKNMGAHVASCLGKTREEMTWNGDSEGVCPICHCDQLTVRKGTTVECTVCGCIGHLSVVDGEIKVNYSKEQLMRSRYRYGGDMEHCLEIEGMGQRAGKIYMENKEKIADAVKALDIVSEIKK